MKQFLYSLFTGLVFFLVLALAFYFWKVTLALMVLVVATYCGAFIREVIFRPDLPLPDTRLHCDECGVPLGLTAPRPPRDREVS